MSTLVKPDPKFWKEKRVPVANLSADRHYSTLKEYAEVGCRSKATGEMVQLEAIWEGGILVSTEEAYLRFLKKLNGWEK